MLYVIRQWPRSDIVGIALHLERHGLEFQIIESWSMPLYPSLTPDDIVIGLGGPPSVGRLGESSYEWPFMTLEAGFVAQAMALDVPFLGICLSHQLRAKLAQATVSPGPLEFGAVDVELTEEGRRHWLFEGMPARMKLFCWHHDYVSDLPEGVPVLARSAMCPIHAVDWGDCQVGVQFHPEAMTEILRMKMEQADLVALGVTAEEMTAAFPSDYPVYTQRLFDNFLLRATAGRVVAK